MTGGRLDSLRELAATGTRLTVEALYVAQRIETRQLEAERVASTPLVVKAGAHGLCVLFRYGVVVFVQLTDAEMLAFRTAIAPLLREPFAEPVTDRLQIAVPAVEADRVNDEVVACPDLDVERIQVIADALAKNVALTQHELTVAAAFDEVEPLASRLAQTGTTPRRARSLAMRIGNTLQTQTLMVGRVEAAEKPEVLWEHPELEPLYARLSDELELVERHRELERKLAVMASAARSLLDLRMHAQSLRVEWYIVALIMVEILISLFEMVR